ncbi:BspA family leucine-rich repeat surface protein [Vibrio splendidus]
MSRTKVATVLASIILAAPVVAKTYSVKIPHNIPLSTSERVIFEGEWVNIDSLYACSEPLPITNDVDENKAFTQGFECSQKQERDVTKEIYVTQTGEVLSSIDSKQSQSIVVPQSQDAVGTGNKCLTKAELSSLISSGADVTKANTSCINDFSRLFMGNKTFNQDIGGWDVSNGTNFDFIFSHAAAFNQDIGQWNVSKGTSFAESFSYSTFNKNINGWDVSNGLNFHGMFAFSEFNQDVGSWNVSKGTSFSIMFYHAGKFNQDIGSWDVSNSVNFKGMFEATPFNQNIGRWDVSKGTDFSWMFAYTPSFNQNISGWDTGKAAIYNSFKDESPLSDANTPPKFR